MTLPYHLKNLLHNVLFIVLFHLGVSQVFLLVASNMNISEGTLTEAGACVSQDLYYQKHCVLYIPLGKGSDHNFTMFLQPKSFRMGGGGSGHFKIEKHV